MKKTFLTHSFALLLLAGPASVLTAQNIVLNGGSADITFFYESAADRWDVVLRNKGTTSATGLTNAYQGFPNIEGDGDDFNFDNLRVNLNTTTIQNVNGTDYFISSANGSTIFNSVDVDSNYVGTADLGIRTRLRENPGEVNQFANFRITLNSITGPAGSEFAFFGWDGVGNVANIRYQGDTANVNVDSFDWPNWGHTHWHYGFSEFGLYTLNFTGQGIGGLHGDSGTVDFSIEFNVIPEPGTYAAIVGFFALAGVLFVRHRRNKKS